MGWLDKLLFWRDDDPEFGVEGCFTLPGAELDAESPAVEVDQVDAACEAPALED